MPPAFDVFEFDDWREAAQAWRGQDGTRTYRWLGEQTGVAFGHIRDMLSPERRRPASAELLGQLSALMDLDTNGRRFFDLLVRADVAEERGRAATDEAARAEHEAQARIAKEEAEILRILHVTRRDNATAAELIERWHALVLQEALSCPAIPSAPGELAARMVPPLPVETVGALLDWLVRQGYARRTVRGTIADGDELQWYTADADQQERRRVLRSAHLHALGHYVWGLDPQHIAREERDYKFAIQALPADLLPLLREKVEELLAWIHAEAGRRPDCDRVYVLGFQAVPVLRGPPAGAEGEAHQEVGSSPTR